MTPAQLRAWAAANGVDCPRTGRVPRSVYDAYNAQVVDEIAVENAEAAGEPVFAVTVTIPGADQDWTDAISGHLVEAVWAAYYAGRAAERAALLAQLADQ